MWEAIKAWCYHSETVAWGYIKIFGGAFLLSFHEIIEFTGDFVNNDQIRGAIASMNFPAYVGLGLAVMGFITLYVRMRKMSNDPVH